MRLDFSSPGVLYHALQKDNPQHAIGKSAQSPDHKQLIMIIGPCIQLGSRLFPVCADTCTAGACHLDIFKKRPVLKPHEVSPFVCPIPCLEVFLNPSANPFSCPHPFGCLAVCLSICTSFFLSICFSLSASSSVQKFLCLSF